MNFQVSGLLWNRSLVMRDLETNSLWSHLLGKAMRGELKGTELKILPGVMTTWEEWRLRHPKTTLLGMSRTARSFRQAVWKKPGQFVYGVHLGAGRPSPAVAFRRLQQEPVFNFEAGGHLLLATAGSRGIRARVFNRRIKGEVYSFSEARRGVMTDDRTSSRWDVATGECLDGKMKGAVLNVLPGTVSFRSAWRDFFPDGRIFE